MFFNMLEHLSIDEVFCQFPLLMIGFMPIHINEVRKGDPINSAFFRGWLGRIIVIGESF